MSHMQDEVEKCQNLNEAISRNRRFLNEQIQQGKEYTKDEAKILLKKLLKRLYDSIN